MPQPLTLFQLQGSVGRAVLGRRSPSMQCARLPLTRGVVPLPVQPPITITGVTRDGLTNAIMTSVVVDLIRITDSMFVETTVSDASTGAYTFFVVGMGSLYRVDSRDAAGSKAGSTVSTLQGT